MRDRLLLVRGRDLVIERDGCVSIERLLLSERQLRGTLIVCAAWIVVGWALSAEPIALVPVALFAPLVIASWFLVRADPLRVGVTRPLLRIVASDDATREPDLVAFADASSDGFVLQSGERLVRVLVSAADGRALAHAGTELRAVGIRVGGLRAIEPPYRS